MSEIFDSTTLITIAIAVFMIMRFRSVLGKRTGYEEPPQSREELDRMRKAQIDAANSNESPADNVVPMTKGKSSAKRISKDENPSFAAIDAYAKKTTKLNKGLKAVATSTPGFEPKGFLSGAHIAYEMIVTAFADGDKKALKGLLSKEVYEGFAGAITEREKAGEKVMSQFISIEKSTIKVAEIADKEALVTVQFISQMISSTLDKDGEIIDGDAEQIVEVNDIWTFGRDTRSKDPNWKLVATESDA